MKALRAIGLGTALKYLVFSLLYFVYRLLPFSQLRVPFLRLLGVKIGRDCIIHNVRFFNYYRAGFKALKIGDECFIGDETLIDLADSITLEDKVTLAERVIVMTHINVGYEDHPLQKYYPSATAPVVIHKGSFIGTSATILSGAEIGPEAFVAACALVRDKVPARSVAGGVPAKVLKSLP